MTTYEQSKVQLVVNKMDNDCWEHLSSKSNEEIYIVGSNPSGVVKIDLDALGDLDTVMAEVQTMASAIDLTNSHVSALESAVGDVSASVEALGSSVGGLTSSVEALGSQVTAMASSVSAMASSISGKRDYLDLTYNTTTPAETIDNSKLDFNDQDPLYNAKLTFTLNDSVEGEQHLTYDELDGIGLWIDRSLDEGSHHLFYVLYAEDQGYDPADGKFCLVDSSDVCLQFDLEDGVNVQTFNYTSEMMESTGTLTMTFTGEPAHVVNDNLALDSNLGVVGASVSTLTSRVSSLSSKVSANTSAIADNTSAISSLTSSISAVAGSLNVSGIGCSTVVMSGTYSDSTSFAFNVVVQPSA